QNGSRGNTVMPELHNKMELLKERIGPLLRLLETFWAEVVSTACYVLNRVLVTKPQNKTLYELITGPKEANHSAEAKNGDEMSNGDTGPKTNEEPKDQEDQAFLEELERLKR
ncbi:hypothetical protein Tco_0113165, partial [Tanacetum coccineum]